MDGGSSASSICNGITDATSNANFIAPFILDPNNDNRMLAGGASLWQSTSVKAAVPAWASVKAPIGTGVNYYISAIAVAEGHADKAWVGHNNGAVTGPTRASVHLRPGPRSGPASCRPGWSPAS